MFVNKTDFPLRNHEAGKKTLLTEICNIYLFLMKVYIYIIPINVE